MQFGFVDGLAGCGFGVKRDLNQDGMSLKCRTTTRHLTIGVKSSRSMRSKYSGIVCESNADMKSESNQKQNPFIQRIQQHLKSVLIAHAVTAFLLFSPVSNVQPGYAFLEEPQVSSALSPVEQSTIALFERSKPSVVFVSTYQAARGRLSTNIMEIPQGQGSGIVWDSNGHIVTNYHVIKGASSAKILLDNQSTLDAELVGADPDKDIAVLKVSPTNGYKLVPITIGNSNALKVGQSVFAIGNPFGLDHSLSAGIVSGLGREMRSPTGRPLTNVIQTDCAINPGNSGGPLLDSSGGLIGMNTSIYSPSGASAGVGFAIPSSTLNQVVKELIQYGRIVRPIIGISYLESSQARALGIQKGVLVLDVPSGSRAEKAGLKGTSRTGFSSFELGDVIVAVDNEPIPNEAALFEVLESKKVDQTVTLTVEREDTTRNINIKLSARETTVPAYK
mmetsp:Transcript_4953/g.8596  ORF Transcript_4953/g.8596 Transcript_4953/m.8596 type:complete len:448 (-) Transcript_4953:30-1373(-)